MIKASDLVGQTVIVHPFDDRKVVGRLSNHKPGLYQVTGEYLGNGEFDSWVFRDIEVSLIAGNDIYLYNPETVEARNEDK